VYRTHPPKIPMFFIDIVIIPFADPVPPGILLALTKSISSLRPFRL
jgi:hypothetical protein